MLIAFKQYEDENEKWISGLFIFNILVQNEHLTNANQLLTYNTWNSNKFKITAIWIILSKKKTLLTLNPLQVLVKIIHAVLTFTKSCKNWLKTQKAHVKRKEETCQMKENIHTYNRMNMCNF